MSIDNQPLVSIITVNYNTVTETVELLKSLRLISYSNIEIIVVDNASVEECAFLKNQFPEIQFIKNEKNEGFAGGNNKGIEIARGEIIFLLNNDTEVDKNFIEPVVSLFKENSKIGIISSKLLYHERKEIIQYAGGTKINALTARGKFIGAGEIDTNQYPNPIKTHLAHGAAMAIHKKVFDKIGLLPEMYFLYYEELDFSEHALKAGFEIWFQPNSVVYHKESMSVGKLSSIKVYYQNRNRLLFIRRNYSGLEKIISTLFFLCISAPLKIVKYLLSGNLLFATMIYRGLKWNFLYKIK